VLATPGTIARVYTRDLIRSFAQDCHVRLVGAPDLAGIAEARMRGEPIDRALIAAQIAPCFVEIGKRRTDIVVLACTHYPFLDDVMAELAPWPVTWLDPAPAIARRLVSVLERKAVERGREAIAIFTSGRVPASLAGLLRQHGLTASGPMAATPEV
jgi:glutamate racemase